MIISSEVETEFLFMIEPLTKQMSQFSEISEEERGSTTISELSGQSLAIEEKDLQLFKKIK